MDFNWMPYFGGFWIFPLLCMVFMIVMMIACGSMSCRFGRRSRNANGREGTSRSSDAAAYDQEAHPR